MVLILLVHQRPRELPDDLLPPDEDAPDEEPPELRDGAEDGAGDGADGGGEYDGAGRELDPELLDRSEPLDRAVPPERPWLVEDPDELELLEGRPNRSGNDHDRVTVEDCRDVGRVRPPVAAVPAGRVLVAGREGDVDVADERPAVRGVTAGVEACEDLSVPPRTVVPVPVRTTDPPSRPPS